MNLWGATPFLAAVLLAGGHPGAKPAAPSQQAITASLVATARTTPQPASMAAASAVLTRVGTGTWHTTVLLNGAVALPCPQRSDFSLETSGPAKIFPPDNSPPSEVGPSVPCHYMNLSFSGLTHIPASAVLVLRAPGAQTAAIPVSFSRPISLRRYFLLPIGAGLAMVLLLFASAVAFIRVYDWDDTRVRRLSRSFWRYSVVASGTWTVGDSWATNITPIIGILATAFGITSAASSLFPGVDLDPFEIVNLAAVAIITAVPLAFSILYARWTMKNPGPSADSIIEPATPLPAAIAGAADPLPVGAAIRAPVGAVLTLTDGGSIGAGRRFSSLVKVAITSRAVKITAVPQRTRQLKSGATIPIPPRARLDIVPGKSISLPGGPDVLVTGVSALQITTGDGAPLPVPAGQFVAAAAKAGRKRWPVRGAKRAHDAAQGGPDGPPGTMLPSPLWVLAPGGAKVTAAGVANVWLPAKTQITAPRRHCPQLPTERRLLVPQGSNTMVANMGLVIISALLTIFGVGVQVGLAAVLIGYSDASQDGRRWLFALMAAVALFTLYYSTTAMRTLADPQPGSSLSAVSGTSFTL